MVLPPPHNRGWILPSIIVVLVLIAGGLGGVWAALITLALGFAGIAAFHLAHLYILQRWTTSSLEHYTPLPEGMGVWGDVLAALLRREQKRVAFQKAQRQTIEQFHRMAEALPDGVIVLDDRRHIEWANLRAQQWLTLDLEKDRGRPLGNLVRMPEFLRFLADDLDETPSGDDLAQQQRTLVIPSVFDTGKTLELQQVPFGHGGRLLLARDVTQYEAAARLRRDFIASVSHELKTPLTVIVGFLETLQETPAADMPEQTRAHYANLMRTQADSMQRLVDDLLTLSALESGAREKEEEWFEVAPLLQTLQQQTQVLSQNKHTVTLTVPEEKAQIYGVRDELVSAFNNLLTNAVRYTPEGGNIELSWAVDKEGRGIFAVRDTGIGIAAEHLPRLTERFYRVDRGRSRASGGTGLGLAIVKHVLLRHQGELTIDSRVGKGSTFSAVLPVARVGEGG
ncbi:MAG: phosphate regulon sensor histidine kinase PhoR [Burkholderiales bacterium]|jgi:two-component system phosphate regulon sensor histidine kinase PhoR|nr:phosphate regulon sensor histidine kinase PhoR [Burkholderiales bacterium]